MKFSGFKSIEQEKTYDLFLFKLIEILSKEVVDLQQRAMNFSNPNFNKKINKIHKALLLMENEKDSQPNFSSSIKSLIFYLHSQIDYIAEERSVSYSRLSKSSQGDIGGVRGSFYNTEHNKTGSIPNSSI